MMNYPEGPGSSKFSQYLLSEAGEQTDCHLPAAQDTCLNEERGPSEAPWISELDLLSIFIGHPLNSEDVQNQS